MAASYAPFVWLGPPHLTVLLLTAVVAAALVAVARCWPATTARTSQSLAAFLLALFPISWVVAWRMGVLNSDNRLPCHLCDLAALCGAGALWFRHQRLAELTWFWGLAGTLNGLITPALAESFPSPRFLSFFALHSGVVVAALYLVLGLGLRPQRGAVWRAFAWIQLYLAAAAVVNFFTGSNYGFLRSKPDQASLMDAMGPWPWYILGLEVLALVLFTLLYLPFRRIAESPGTVR